MIPAVSTHTKERLFSTASTLTIIFFVSQSVLQKKRRTSSTRPLLGVNRYDTKKLCQLWKIPVYPDPTNKELVFSRNRVRKQLLPMLRSFFNPQIDVVLSHLSEVLLLERLYTEYIGSKLCRDSNHCNAFQLPHTILRFGEARTIAREWPVRDTPARHSIGSKDQIVARLNGRTASSHFPTRLGRIPHDTQLSHNRRIESSITWCLPLSVKQAVWTQFMGHPWEWKMCMLRSKIQQKCLLSILLKKLTLQAVKIKVERPRRRGCLPLAHDGVAIEPLATDKNLDCDQVTGYRCSFRKIDGKGSYREGHAKECFSLCLNCKKKTFCQPGTKLATRGSLVQQYFYFPKIGGLLL